ncbi:MAG: PAS domain S-box protein [Desulfobacteraceae bacterium]|nr:PAS domain S-box protein [Desulfobacteraceae bacterium]
MIDVIPMARFRGDRSCLYGLAGVVVWTALLALSLSWNGFQVNKSVIEAARIQARSNYMKDVVYRRWNSIHGGVYAPVTDWTPPNPYLSDTPERDVQTPSGKALTKINPAYMTRQAFELGLAEYGLRGHITSLNPIRIENAPDTWEAEALKAFETGKKEVDTLETLDGRQYLRLMRPLITEQSCLPCHARQGYRLNEIRGGISVAVPTQPFQAIAAQRQGQLIIVHVLLWLIGIGGIVFAARRLALSRAKRREAEEALRQTCAEMEQQVVQRTFDLKMANEALQADIAKRKATEERLRRSETHLAAAQHVARMGSWMLELKTLTGLWSEEMFRITGFDPAEGTPPLSQFIEMLHPDDRPIQARLHERLLATGQAEQAEFRTNPQRGPVKYLLARADVVRDGNGEITAFVGTLQDITEHKVVTDAIEAEKKKFQTLIDESPFAVALVDQGQRFRYLNPRFKEVFGYSIQEIPTRHDWFQVAYPDPAYRQKVIASWQQAGQHANPGMIRNQSWQVRCKDGAHKWVQISTAYLASGETIITYEDISERLSMEERLRQSQKMEAIGTLAGGIAHDFNNILSAILGYAELVKADALPESATAAYIGEVIRAGVRARNLIQHILDFSRQSKPEKAPLALHLVVKETLSLLRATIPASITIHQQITASGMVLGDSNQMHQVVMNLCTNACQAMRMKEGTLGISLKPITLDIEEVGRYPELRPGPYLQLSVSDTGCGITPDIIQRIFDPYFTTKPQGEGTGLGLSVIHGIVKDHGGAITVYSEPGKGSTFHAYLPLIESGQAGAEAQPEPPLPRGRERILFVDDEPSLIEVSKRMLSTLGYQVETRSSGNEALALLREAPLNFDLLITDMTMPYMTGLELAEEVLRFRPDLPIIVCTGFSYAITEQKAKAIGIRQMVMKPLILRELADIVRRVLDVKDAR